VLTYTAGLSGSHSGVNAIYSCVSAVDTAAQRDNAAWGTLVVVGAGPVGCNVSLLVFKPQPQQQSMTTLCGAHKM